MAKRFEQLTISDDFMFGKVTMDEKVCRVLLETLLQRPVGELSEIVTQKELRNYEDGKYIRMDLYTREDSSVIEAEMQNKGSKSIHSLALGKRTRYYQSTIDTDFLDRGRPYSELPESTILFICTFDPFGQGRWRYTFNSLCVEDAAGAHNSEMSDESTADEILRLGDGTTKIFFNCTYKGNEAEAGVQGFYDYVTNATVTTEATRIIDEAVQRARLNETWRSEYMKELLHDYDVRTDGEAIGEERGISIGKDIGSGLVNSLGRLMNEAGRMDEFISSMSDPELQKRLMAEFGLSAESLTENAPVGV